MVAPALPEAYLPVQRGGVVIVAHCEEGKIKNAAERASLCHVLAALAGAPGRGSGVAAAATAAAEFLCAFYKVCKGGGGSGQEGSA